MNVDIPKLRRQVVSTGRLVASELERLVLGLDGALRDVTVHAVHEGVDRGAAVDRQWILNRSLKYTLGIELRLPVRWLGHADRNIGPGRGHAVTSDFKGIDGFILRYFG